MSGTFHVVCVRVRMCVHACEHAPTGASMSLKACKGADAIATLSFPTGGTKIAFVTEGILLRIMASDPMLSQYDVIIVVSCCLRAAVMYYSSYL